MNSLEEMIMEEISTLPEMQLIDVLGFIRYLKSETSETPRLIEQWFDGAQKSIHARKVEFKLTQEDIETRSRTKRSTRK
ncbi:MAG: hypothetical protein JNM02_13175 [Anaerolineales bacterium]|nr:hypothetical protein [Anaerolineales bacterium]